MKRNGKHRPPSNAARRHPPATHQRDGFILILVLAMLALIAILGVGFTNFSGQEMRGAEARDRAFQGDRISGDDISDAIARINTVLDAVVCDSIDPTSALRGHSLCRDLWGNDRIERITVNSVVTQNNTIDDDNDGITDEPDEIGGIILDFSASTFGAPATARGYLNGRTLLFRQSAQLNGQHGEIVRYASQAPAFPALAFVKVSPALPRLPQNGDVVAVLQRPFNGTGDRDMSDTPVVPYWVLNPALQPVPNVERTQPNPLFPDASLYMNFVFNGRNPETRILSTGVNLQATGGFDEPWDMADLQNMYLAAVKADGTLLLPSYYRPGQLVLADWTNELGRMKILRPRPIDQGLMPGPDGIFGTADDVVLFGPGPDTIYGTNDDQAINPPQFIVNPQGQQIPVDVDNDADGILDSIWMDVGLPIITQSNGMRVKPLAAVLVIDMDAKLNLNVHGNNAMADANGPFQQLDLNEDGTLDVDRFHGSNLGASPSEVNIGAALAGADGLDNDNDGQIDELDEIAEQWYLLSGRFSAQGTPVGGRHGEQFGSNFPPSGPAAGLTGTTANPIDDDNDRLQWRTATHIPPDTVDDDADGDIDELDERHRLLGLMDTNGDGNHQLRPWHLTKWGTIRNPQDTRDAGIPAAQQAIISQLSQGNLGLWSALAENYNEADEFNPYLAVPFDGLFTLIDNEWLWRAHDLGGNALNTRLSALAPLSFVSPLNPTLGLVFRRHFTTQGWDWSDYGLMPDVWRDPAMTLDDRTGRTDLATLFSGYFDHDGDGVLEPNANLPVPPALAAGLRLNLNFPLGNGLDDDSDGLVDEFDEPYVIDQDTPLARYAMSMSNPPLSLTFGIPNPGPPATLTLNGGELRVLQALQLYSLLYQIAYPKTPTTSIDPVADALDLAQLAQLAVNIVDFRDPDDEVTVWPLPPYTDPAGVLPPITVRGVEYPRLVINETLVFAREGEDAIVAGQGIVQSGELFVEIYNPGHPDRPVATRANLTDYRIVFDVDANSNNLPDSEDNSTPPPAAFALNNGQPTTTIDGGEYMVLGTSNQPPAPSAMIPLPRYIPASASLPAILSTPNAQNLMLGDRIPQRWKVFLQRQPVPGQVGPIWVTIDQASVKIWIVEFSGMVTPPATMLTHIHQPGLAVNADAELVSRERREPFRAEPALPNDQLQNPPALLLIEPSTSVGGPAARFHPVAGTTTFESNSLAQLNWNSDVDDINGNKADDDPVDLDGDGVQDPQTDAVPSVAWPPVAVAPNVARSVGMDFLPWLDRDYANAGELLLVPGVASQDLTALFRDGGIDGSPVDPIHRYLYQADVFEQRTIDATTKNFPWLFGPRGLHRLLEFTEVPTPQNGYQDPNIPPGRNNRKRRVPGNLNLNTIQDPLVLAAMADHPWVSRTPADLTVAFSQWLQNPRGGPDSKYGTNDDRPFIFGHDGFTIAGTIGDYSLLRGTTPGVPFFSIDDDFGFNEPPASPYYTDRTGDYRNPWFKQEVLRKISRHAGNRSNVFAVWITIGYFEVVDEPVPNGVDDDGDGSDSNGDGIISPAEYIDEPDELLPRLGKEIGAATGQAVRNRAFFIVDRTRSVGFDPLLQDVQNMVIYRTIIQ